MSPGFFDPAGDELQYRGITDIFIIPPGAMPTDGIHSLERDLSTALLLLTLCGLALVGRDRIVRAD